MGNTFVVIASGPSMTEADADYVRGRAVIVTANDGYAIAPWADHVYAYDLTWWGHHKRVVDHACPRAQLWTGREASANVFPGVRFVETLRGPVRLCRDKLTNGQNSGMQAMTLSYVLGARRILLLGFDMQHTGGHRHFFGRHPHGWGNADTCHKWIAHFDAIAPQFIDAGVEVVNCTRQTALTSFPRATIEDAL